MDINSIDKLLYVAACHPRNKKELKGKKGMHKIKMLLNFIREKKKDLIQLSNNEYYKSNEYKIKNSKKVNYEDNRMLVI